MAPPIFLPLSPASSMNFAAGNLPFTAQASNRLRSSEYNKFLNEQPALGKSSGCEQRRFFHSASISASFSSPPASFASANVTSEIIQFLFFLKMLSRYAKPHSSFVKIFKPTSSSTTITSTSSTKSPTPWPYAPALPKTAPPTVPGILATNSRPAKPLFTASRTKPPSKLPANTFMRPPLISVSPPSSLITSPSIPLSAIKTLLPPPRMVNGIFRSTAAFTALNNCALFFTTTKNLAGPPILIVVYFLGGWFASTGKPINFSSSFCMALLYQIRKFSQLAFMRRAQTQVAPIPLKRGEVVGRRGGADERRLTLVSIFSTRFSGIIACLRIQTIDISFHLHYY